MERGGGLIPRRSRAVGIYLLTWVLVLTAAETSTRPADLRRAAPPSVGPTFEVDVAALTHMRKNSQDGWMDDTVLYKPVAYRLCDQVDRRV